METDTADDVGCRVALRFVVGFFHVGNRCCLVISIMESAYVLDVRGLRECFSFCHIFYEGNFETFDWFHPNLPSLIHFFIMTFIHFAKIIDVFLVYWKLHWKTSIICPV